MTHCAWTAYCQYMNAVYLKAVANGVVLTRSKKAEIRKTHTYPKVMWLVNATRSAQ